MYIQSNGVLDLKTLMLQFTRLQKRVDDWFCYKKLWQSVHFRWWAFGNCWQRRNPNQNFKGYNIEVLNVGYISYLKRNLVFVWQVDGEYYVIVFMNRSWIIIKTKSSVLNVEDEKKHNIKINNMEKENWKEEVNWKVLRIARETTSKNRNAIVKIKGWILNLLTLYRGALYFDFLPWTAQ